MANRTDSPPPSPQEAAEGLGQALADSAQQIWLAGLGAFARAKDEGDRMFERLVEQGKDLRTRSRGAAEEALRSMRTQADSGASQAQGQWERLERAFEDRLTRSLQRLGLATTREVQALTQEIMTLNAAVRAMRTGSAPRRAAAPKRKATAKATAKKRTRKLRR